MPHNGHVAPDWMDPGHDLPPAGTYRNLDAWVNSDGKVYVGNRAIEVLPAAKAVAGSTEPRDLLVTDEIKRRFDAMLVRNGLPPVYGTAAPGSKTDPDPAERTR